MVGKVPNEWPHGDTDDVLGELVTTTFTGDTLIIEAHFASEISPKMTFDNQRRFQSSCFEGWEASDKALYDKGLYNDDAICMA